MKKPESPASRRERSFTVPGLSEVQKWGEFVKFSHTIFALPFALASMAVAARDNQGWPGLRVFLLILLAMVCARTCAMVFNRIVDRDFDRDNPRTAQRHLPSGKISLLSAWTLWGLSAAGFIGTSYLINTLCFYLSPIVLFVICFYSLTKRFTDFSHFYLGAAVAMAPLGAWVAVRESLHILPVILSLAVVFWLVGFDIIYALQDYEFDRKRGLRSLVVRWGVGNALKAAFLSHMTMWVLLALFGFFCRFRVAYFVALTLIFVLLALEHLLARRRSLNWVQNSFFRLNALISIVFLVATVAEVLFPPLRMTE